jgi:hypothetical protein
VRAPSAIRSPRSLLPRGEGGAKRRMRASPKRRPHFARTLTPDPSPHRAFLVRPSLDELWEREIQPRLRVTMSRTSGDSDGFPAIRRSIASA